MEGLESSLDGKSFVALLKALGRKNFFHDKTVTDESIGNEIYGELASSDVETVNNEIHAFEQVLQKAAREFMETSKLQTILQTTPISKEHLQLLLAYWTNERDNIHSLMLKRSRWNNEYHQLYWRVDLKAASKHAPDINEPLAIFEFCSKTPPANIKAKQLTTSSTAGDSTDISRTQFQMDRTQLDEMKVTLDTIKKCLADAGSNSGGV